MRLRPHAATASALLIAGFLTLSFQPAQAQSGTRVWSHEIGAQLWAPLAHEDGTLYFGADDGTFRAFDIGSREVSWRFDTGGMIRSTPVVDRGDVYFGSWDGNVYAVSAAGGSLVWQFDTGGIVQGSPALGAGKVFVGSRSAAVFALDAGSGELAWKHVNADGSWVESSPVYSDGVVYVGNSDALTLRSRLGDRADDLEVQDRGVVLEHAHPGQRSGLHRRPERLPVLLRRGHPASRILRGRSEDRREPLGIHSAARPGLHHRRDVLPPRDR